MDATAQNYKLAYQILSLLAAENVSVAQAKDILSFVSRDICESSPVHYDPQRDFIAQNNSDFMRSVERIVAYNQGKKQPE